MPASLSCEPENDSCIGSVAPLTPLRFFKCLADDTRVRIMRLIEREGELCVCELTCALAESQPKISRHLAQLRSGGLLTDRRQGQWVYYRLHADMPAWARTALASVMSADDDAWAADTRRLQQMGDRPARLASCC